MEIPKKRTTPAILAHVSETLGTAERGLELLVPRSFETRAPGLGARVRDALDLPAEVPPLMHASAALQRDGLRIVCVFGVAVSHALQNLRRTEPDSFDEWWSPISAALEEDELSRFFYRLRSVIIKEGWLKETATGVSVEGDGDLIKVTARLGFAQPPAKHKGEDVSALHALELATLYYTWMREIVLEAWAKFSPSSEPSRYIAPFMITPAPVDDQPSN